MKSRLLPAAKLELANAANHYEGAQPGLGGEFISEFDKAIERVLNNNRIGPLVVATTAAIYHELIFTRFPYRLVYSIEQDGILVVAVAHQHRLPLYWRDRVREPAPSYEALAVAA
jgi:plasmid stabilization system protein ParE